MPLVQPSAKPIEGKGYRISFEYLQMATTAKFIVGWGSFVLIPITPS